MDFGRGNGSFPVGSDSREKNGKKGGFGPEKQVKKWLFYRLNANSFVFKQFDMLNRENDISQLIVTN
ncbi:hypothetical protein KMW35_20580 [Parabacteroides distasonis]|nr:hypothetical protein [Parabacteroides distasonis]